MESLTVRKYYGPWKLVNLNKDWRNKTVTISGVKNKGSINIQGSTDVIVRKRWSEFKCLKVAVSMLPIISRIIAKRLEIGCITYKLKEGIIE